MEEKQRIVFLDWLRAAACLMVMLVHASECVYSNDYSFSFPSELARWSVMFIQGFVRPVAVPLFLMASAYLLVPVKDKTGVFLKKRFSRVGIPFVVFLFLYAFLPAVFGLLDPLMPVPLAIILTAILTYCLSYLISSLIGKLPFGKYIVG